MLNLYSDGIALSRSYTRALNAIKSRSHPSQSFLSPKWKYRLACFISFTFVLLCLSFWIPWIPARLVLNQESFIQKSPMDIFESRKAKESAEQAEQKQDWVSAQFHWERAMGLNPSDEETAIGWIRSLAYPPLNRKNYLRLKNISTQSLQQKQTISTSVTSTLVESLIFYRDFQLAEQWGQMTLVLPDISNSEKFRTLWQLARCKFWNSDWLGFANLLIKMEKVSRDQNFNLMDKNYLHQQIEYYVAAYSQITGNVIQPELENLQKLLPIQIPVYPIPSERYFLDTDFLRIQLTLARVRQDQLSESRIMADLETRGTLLLEDQLPGWKRKLNEEQDFWEAVIFPKLKASNPFSKREMTVLTQFFRNTGHLKQLQNQTEQWLAQESGMTDPELEMALLDLLIEQKEWTQLQFATARLRNRGALGSHLSGLTFYLDGLANLKTQQSAQAVKHFQNASRAEYRTPEVGLHVFAGLWKNGRHNEALRLITSLETDLESNPHYWNSRLKFHSEQQQHWEAQECLLMCQEGGKSPSLLNESDVGNAQRLLQNGNHSISTQSKRDPVFDSFLNSPYDSIELQLKKNRLKEIKQLQPHQHLWSPASVSFDFRMRQE